MYYVLLFGTEERIKHFSSCCGCTGIKISIFAFLIHYQCHFFFFFLSVHIWIIFFSIIVPWFNIFACCCEIRKSFLSKLLLVSIVTVIVCLQANTFFWTTETLELQVFAGLIRSSTDCSFQRNDFLVTNLCVICTHIMGYAWCRQPHLTEIIDFTASHHRHGVMQDFGVRLCQALCSPIPSGTIQEKATDVNTWAQIKKVLRIDN